MKSLRLPLYGIAIVIWLFSSTSGIGLAQCITFQPNYSVYTDASTDGSKIYTTVEIDGSGTMTVNRSAPGCGGIVVSAVHTPSTYNMTGTVGGLNTGEGECPDCYLYSRNDQIIVGIPGEEYPFHWSAYVTCSQAGQFYSVGGYIGLRIAVTTYKISTVNANGSVSFIQACPGTSKATCGAANYLGTEPTIWAEEFQLGVTIGGSRVQCFPVSIIQYLNGPPAPYPCT